MLFTSQLRAISKKDDDHPQYRRRIPLIVIGIFVPWAGPMAKAHARKFIGQMADSWAAEQTADTPEIALLRSTQK